jgi:hypothetical protein
MFHCFFCVYKSGLHPSPKAVDLPKTESWWALQRIRCTKLGSNPGAPNSAPFF